MVGVALIASFSAISDRYGNSEHHRLFSAGRDPQKLVVVDSDSGKVLASFAISDGVDAAAYEAETGLIFVSTREGFVHVFHEDSPDKFSGSETIKTEVGTMGLDTKTHKLFLDTVEFGPAAGGSDTWKRSILA